MCERNIDWLPLTRPQLGIWPTTQACALTGNRTGDPLIHRLALNPLSRASQGRISYVHTVESFLCILECIPVLTVISVPCDKRFTLSHVNYTNGFEGVELFLHCVAYIIILSHTIQE